LSYNHVANIGFINLESLIILLLFEKLPLKTQNTKH
jgi:hypothetical protein